MKIRYAFDTEQVKSILQSGGEEGLSMFAEDIGRESEKLVPVDKGALLRSKTVQAEEDTAVISYDTTYAAALHEHPEYDFQRGRKGKFLEEPVNDPAAWSRGLRYLANNMKL